jgi:hypothetical protein
MKLSGKKKMKEESKEYANFYPGQNDSCDHILPIIRQTSDNLEISTLEEASNSHQLIQNLIFEYLNSVGMTQQAHSLKNDFKTTHR